MNQALKSFYAAVSENTALRAKLEQATQNCENDPCRFRAAYLRIAAENGFPLTGSDLTNDTELTDEELAAAAGGTETFPLRRDGLKGFLPRNIWEKGSEGGIVLPIKKK